MHFEMNVFNVQTLLTNEYLSKVLADDYDLVLKKTALRDYVSYLLHIGLIARQTQFDEVQAVTYKEKKNVNHNLANCISLVNLNVYGFRIIENASKLFYYCQNNNKNINRINVIDLTLALGFNNAKEIYNSPIIVSAFKKHNVELTNEMKQQMIRYHKQKELIEKNPELISYLLKLKKTPSHQLSKEDQIKKKEFQQIYKEYENDNFHLELKLSDDTE